MKKLVIHLFSILLVVALLLPSIVKLAHAVYEHEEIICLHGAIEHVHSVELDCDLQKFNLSPQIYPVITVFEENLFSQVNQEDTNYYTFQSKYQKLHFELRGPPFTT